MQKIIEHLLSKEKGIIILSAPTQSGKTIIAHKIKENKPNTKVISAELFCQAVLQPYFENGQTELLCELYTYDCICIEDIDWYCNREHIQIEFAKVATELAKDRIVIITGIKIKGRMTTLLSKLTDYEYYYKTNVTDEWK